MLRFERVWKPNELQYFRLSREGHTGAERASSPAPPPLIRDNRTQPSNHPHLLLQEDVHIWPFGS